MGPALKDVADEYSSDRPWSLARREASAYDARPLAWVQDTRAGRCPSRSRPQCKPVPGVPPLPMPVATWVEVDLDRFAANLRAIRRHIGPDREILLVAKADAYGHGSADMAAAAEREGVTQLGVATLLEGLQLRRSGSRLPI